MESRKRPRPKKPSVRPNEQIDLARVEREKQMEAVQEIAEPLVEAGDQVRNAATGRSPASRPSREATEKASEAEAAETASAPAAAANNSPAHEVAPFFYEITDSGFERIVDDEETGG